MPSGNPRYLTAVLFGACFILTAGHLPQAQGKTPDAKIEIFANGKKYDSMSDYKQYRLDQIHQEASEQTLPAVDTPEEKTPDPVKVEEASRSLEIRQNAITSEELELELEVLFQKFMEKNTAVDVEDLSFDPQKVKTINITPGELSDIPTKESQLKMLNLKLSPMKIPFVTQGGSAQ